MFGDKIFKGEKAIQLKAWILISKPFFAMMVILLCKAMFNC